RSPAEYLGPSGTSDRAEVDGVVAQAGFHFGGEVLGVVDDAGQQDPPAGGPGDVDRFGGALVGMDPAEEQDVPVRIGGPPIGKGAQIDAVVDGGGVGQLGVAVGVADGDVVHPVVVGPVDGQDGGAGEPVDRRHDGHVDEPAPGQRQEVEVVVDQVELAGGLGQRCDVERLEHLDVVGAVLLVAAVHDRPEPGPGTGIGGGVQRDVHAEVDEPVGEGGHHLLPGAVVARRSTPGDGGEHGDAHHDTGGVAFGPGNGPSAQGW